MIPARPYGTSAIARKAAAAGILLVALAAAGCGSGANSSDADADQGRSGSTTQRSASQLAPTLPRTISPAEQAGGICGKLGYEQIEQKLGAAFNVAALHRSNNNVESCTLRSTATPLPDLTLAFAPGKLDDKAFDERIKPDGSKEVTGLGTSAYSITRNGSDGTGTDTGPVCEVGWFNDSGSFTLVLTTPASDSRQKADAQLGRLVELGKSIRL